VDTVKTRLQGQPSANPPKYNNMFHAYSTILREEGVSRGLYSGVAPAMTGSREFSFFFFDHARIGCPRNMLSNSWLLFFFVFLID
jgi:hypothetical protein